MAVMMVLLLEELPKSEMSLVTALMNLDLKSSELHILQCVMRKDKREMIRLSEEKGITGLEKREKDDSHDEL